MAKVSIVLGSYNRYKFLKSTIESIRSEIDSYALSAEIIVVDGGSTDGSVKWLTKQKDIISIIQHNRGQWRGKKIERRSWGYFMNLAYKCAQGKYICMVSDDCLIVPGAIKQGLLEFEEKIKDNDKLGALAFWWRNYPFEKQYKVCKLIGNKPTVNHGLFLNKALQDIDYIDETNYNFYYADGDIVLRMYEKGYVLEIASHSYIEHYAHANQKVRKSNFNMEQDDLAYFKQRWRVDENERLGTWDYIEYNDKLNTASKFPLTLRQKVKKIIRF